MLSLVFRDAETRMPQRFGVPAGEARIGRAAGNEIRLLVDSISREHARVTRAARGVRLDDLESKNGILVRGVRVPFVVLEPGDPPVQLGTTFVTVEEADTGDHLAEFPVERAERPERAKVTLPLHAFREATTGKGLQRVVRKSKAMQRVVLRALAFARSARPVLLLGETGTGKEVVARLIAENAQERGPFRKVNCATMTRELIASELFGIEEGVATGVRARRGLFADAEGGTLFLDEIGEIDAEMQATLLRVVEEHEIWPVGGRRSRPVRVRVIFATNRRERLRDDLFFRCKRIVIPPLRERPEDIPALARHFLEQACAARGIDAIPISRSAVALLAAQPWPGNARQLADAVEDAVLLYGDAAMLHVEHIESVLETVETPALSLRERQDALTRNAILRAAEEHGRNKSAVARSVGMSRNGLEKSIRRLGLDRHF
jgi:transcriptional regulator with PAS, ATPase and Fis domain